MMSLQNWLTEQKNELDDDATIYLFIVSDNQTYLNKNIEDWDYSASSEQRIGNMINWTNEKDNCPICIKRWFNYKILSIEPYWGNDWQIIITNN